MKTLSVACVSAGTALAALCPSLHADLTGFAPGSFAFVQNDSGNPPLLLSGGTGIQLTTGTSQSRALWFNQQQSVSQFTVQFTFRVTGTNSDMVPDGIAFVLQSNSTSAIGTGRFAYNGLSHSMGVTTEVILYGSDRSSASGTYFNGVNGGGSLPTMPVNAANGDSIRVNLNYDGQFLSMLYTDLNTGATWAPAPSLVGSLATRIGSPNAYVGFTTTAWHGQISINDFSFTVPTPGAMVLLGVAGLNASRRRR